MRILVLGGYGAMGSVICRDLAESPGVQEVLIGGRDIQKGKALIREIANERGKKHGSLIAAKIDVTDSSLSRKIKALKPDVVVNATWYEYNMTVMPAVIRAGGRGYVDLGGLYYQTLRQVKLHNFARRKGTVCVLGMGSTPGITNAMAHYAADKMDSVESVHIKVGNKVLEKGAAAVTPYAIKTVLDEFALEPVVIRKGRPVRLRPFSEEERFEMPRVGHVTGYPILHSEMAAFPRVYGPKGLKEASFVLGLDEGYKNAMQAILNVGMASKEPLTIGGCKIRPYDFLAEAVKRLPKPVRDPQDVEVLRVDVSGRRKGKKAFVRMECEARYNSRWGKSAGTVDTAVPPSIVAQWIARGRISEPGVWHPDIVLPHEAFFRELGLRDRGMAVYEKVNNGSRRRVD
jgi:lysine 6-dehydrogenase